MRFLQPFQLLFIEYTLSPLAAETTIGTRSYKRANKQVAVETSYTTRKINALVLE